MKSGRLLTAAAVLMLLVACGTSDPDTSSAVPAAEGNSAVVETMAPETVHVPEVPAAMGSEGTITEDKAIDIALSDAGVSAEDVNRLRVRLEPDSGGWEYEVDFYVGNQEYDYDIAYTDGTIRSKDQDIENDHYENGSLQDTNIGITLEEAKSIVLGKVPEASEEQLRIHLDRDDGREIYEGSLVHGTTEYDFEIDAKTGTILEWEKESVFD